VYVTFFERRGTLPEEVDRLDPVLVEMLLAKWRAEYDLDMEARKD
jgi:hypothetical protein